MKQPRTLLNHSMADRLSEQFPDRIGLLLGPSRSRPIRGLPVALDNDRYSVWSKGKAWDEAAYMAMLDRVQSEADPVWAVVPDVVTDADATFREWETWAPRLRARGLTLALAVQDGMTVESVEDNTDPEVIFVGGTTRWKRRTLWQWCHVFPRVHVGRINCERWLWESHRAGAESTDGTGWYRGRKSQYNVLIKYLERSQAGLGREQLELEFARTFGPRVPQHSYVK